jgi:hypothetical protein
MNLRGRVEELVGAIDDGAWRAVSGWLRLARRLFERVPLDARAVWRACANCGTAYHPLEVPCASIYCGRCWARVARQFDLPSELVCRLGSVCSTSSDRALHQLGLVQLELGRAARLGVPPARPERPRRRGLNLDEVVALESDDLDRLAEGRPA